MCLAFSKLSSKSFGTAFWMGFHSLRWPSKVSVTFRLIAVENSYASKNSLFSIHRVDVLCARSPINRGFARFETAWARRGPWRWEAGKGSTDRGAASRLNHPRGMERGGELQRMPGCLFFSLLAGKQNMSWERKHWKAAALCFLDTTRLRAFFFVESNFPEGEDRIWQRMKFFKRSLFLIFPWYRLSWVTFHPSECDVAFLTHFRQCWNITCIQRLNYPIGGLFAKGSEWGSFNGLLFGAKIEKMGPTDIKKKKMLSFESSWRSIKTNTQIGLFGDVTPLGRSEVIIDFQLFRNHMEPF